MRYILVLLLGMASLARLKPQRAKEFLRRRATLFCRGALHWLSAPYGLPSSKAVVFAPHQDDETLGCGGLIARKRNEGLPVDVILSPMEALRIPTIRASQAATS